MTLNQVQSLTDEELELLLFIINVVSPMEFPKIQFQPHQITWFKHHLLIKKLTDVFQKLKPEGHATYISLMEKLGVKIEIKKIEPMPLANSSSVEQPVTSSNEQTGSV